MAARPLILLAHGAGASCASPWMRRWAGLLSELGEVRVFDYPYMQAGRKAPDRLPKLIQAHGEVLSAARAGLDAGRRVILAGKSMGSRVSCHLSLERKVDAVLCLGYPLRGINGKLRDEVLLAMKTPVFFAQGTRDKLCPLDEMRGVVKRMKTKTELFVVASGDHSLEITAARKKAEGIAQAAVDQAIAKAFADFFSQL